MKHTLWIIGIAILTTISSHVLAKDEIGGRQFRGLDPLPIKQLDSDATLQWQDLLGHGYKVQIHDTISNLSANQHWHTLGRNSTYTFIVSNVRHDHSNTLLTINGGMRLTYEIKDGPLHPDDINRKLKFSILLTKNGIIKQIKQIKNHARDQFASSMPMVMVKYVIPLLPPHIKSDASYCWSISPQPANNDSDTLRSKKTIWWLSEVQDKSYTIRASLGRILHRDIVQGKKDDNNDINIIEYYTLEQQFTINRTRGTVQSAAFLSSTLGLKRKIVSHGQVTYISKGKKGSL